MLNDLKANDFFIVPKKTYLLSHSVGCLPKQTNDVASHFFETWAEYGGNAWPAWLNILEDFRCEIAKLLNAEISEICPQTNISSSVYKILYSLPRREKRNKILLSELDFPSVGFVAKQAEKNGYSVKFVKPNDHGELPVDVWVKHFDADVQLALITHVTSENSYRNDVKTITDIAKQKDIFTIVDVAHSAGVLPINLREWSADFVVGTSIKWLCGGTGAAFLWVNKDNSREFFPINIGWFAHENPFEFDIHNFRYAKDAMRFMDGTPSILPYFLAKTSIGLLNKLGVEKIYEHNQRLIEMLIGQLEGSDIRSPLKRSLRGNTLVVSFSDVQNVVDRLNTQGIQVDCRPKYGMRVSPHIYNVEEDIFRFVQALK